MSRHLLTFDIEHWYESWRQRNLPVDKSLPDCDTGCIIKLLDLLASTRQTATFFFTGNFAREFPHIARECVERGHEIASHSLDHTLLTNFESAAAFRENLLASLDEIEKASGARPIGFRAPKWTIHPDNAKIIFPILIEAGLQYDSSIFPGHFSSLPDSPFRIKCQEGEIQEFPASALHLGPINLPTGGAWFRLFPLALSSALFSQRTKSTEPGMFYAHPYDLNPDTHCPAGTPLKLRLIRKINVNGSWEKLASLLNKYSFVSIKDWLKTNEIKKEFTMDDGHFQAA